MFKLCVLTRWDFNFCVRSSPLRGPIDCNGQIFHSNKEQAEMFNDFFIKEATLNNEDDTLPDIPQLVCQLDEIVLSVTEVKKKMLPKILIKIKPQAQIQFTIDY